MFQITLSQKNSSIVSFIFLFAYALSFCFQGPSFYLLSSKISSSPEKLTFMSVGCHFLGILCASFYIKKFNQTKSTITSVCLFSILMLSLNYFNILILDILSILLPSFAIGYAIASWGLYLKFLIPAKERTKALAYILIGSNLIMILISLLLKYISFFDSIMIGILLLSLALFFNLKVMQSSIECLVKKKKITFGLNLLYLFIMILSINSGLMYRIEVAFNHLTWLSLWYWPIPYMLAILMMVKLPSKWRRNYFLYAALLMIVFGFTLLPFLNNDVISYLLISSLVWGAYGIFDLFWLNIIGAMSDFTHRPAKIFGFCFLANITGVMIGSGIAHYIMLPQNFPEINITVVTLFILCISSLLLFPLNHQLQLIIRYNLFLRDYSELPLQQKTKILSDAQPESLFFLTKREEDVLELILEGNSNKEISEKLLITVNTTKTHLKNIFSKYKVSSRVELISFFLKKE